MPSYPILSIQMAAMASVWLMCLLHLQVPTTTTTTTTTTIATTTTTTVTGTTTIFTTTFTTVYCLLLPCDRDS